MYQIRKSLGKLALFFSLCALPFLGANVSAAPAPAAQDNSVIASRDGHRGHSSHRHWGGHHRHHRGDWGRHSNWGGRYWGGYGGYPYYNTRYYYGYPYYNSYYYPYNYYYPYTYGSGLSFYVS